MSESMQEIDREVADVLRLAQNLPRGARRGMGRSMRPGSNHMRRMRTGRLVREHRRDVNDRREQGLKYESSEALIAELERRGLTTSADQVRRGPDSQAGPLMAATTMGTAAAAAMSAAEDGTIDEYQEAQKIEAAVDQRVEELAGDEFEELPIESQREITALTGDEVAEDLVEVGAPEAAQYAHDVASEMAGNDPQAGIEAALEDAHPETLEFPPIQVEQEASESAEL